MPDAWREVLQPLGTDAVKEHLTDAPWVVILFRQSKRLRPNGECKIQPTTVAKVVVLQQVCSFMPSTTWVW